MDETSEHRLIFTPCEDDDWRCSAGDWVNRYGDDPDEAHRTHRAALANRAPGVLSEPRTSEEKVAFRKEWDARVDAGRRP